MTMSFNVKALSAFKKLGAVALITATLAICFTACNQTGGGGGKPTPTPTPKPKYAITFSVDSTTPNGTLKAKADGVPETEASPITVEEGKTVTFTAKADDGYRVKGWTLDGNAVNGTNSSYSFPVTKAAEVKVSFESDSTLPTLYTVNFSVEGENGTLKAKADGVAETEASPITVEEGKTVTFTAKANDGYRVKGWTLDGKAVNGTNNPYSFPVTKAVTVKVSFESNGTPPTPVYTKVAYGTNGADLKAWLQNNAAAAPVVNYIELTGVTRDHLSGSVGNPSPLGKIIQDSGKKVALKLPETVDQIGGRAFYKCTALTGIDLSACTHL